MRSKLLCVISIFVSFLCLSGFAQDMAQVRMLRAGWIEGDVTYQRPDLDRWIDLSVNTPLLEGDKVWVGNNGRAEIEFENGTYLRLNSNSIIELSRLGLQGTSEQVEIRLIRGTGSLDIQQSETKIVLNTPLFSTRVKEAANLRVDLEEDGSGRLVVFQGTVEVAGEKAHLYVRNGETVRFLSDDPERYYLSADYTRDEWDRWGEERNSYVSVQQQDRYIDGDQGWALADLNNYGNWHSDPDYGSIWSPGLGFDWTPYHDGRWVWYQDLGWTWVSYEPWGWVPYHYGRWAYMPAYGWSWVPGPRHVPWCPGAVTWIEGPNWIGWVPLAPHEPWYPHSTSNVLISKNLGNRHGYNFLPRDTFLNGTPAGDFTPPSNARHAGRIIPGQPRYAPTPASRMPLVPSSSPSRTYTNADLDSRRLVREGPAASTDRSSFVSGSSITQQSGFGNSTVAPGASSGQQESRRLSRASMNSNRRTVEVQTSADGVRTYIFHGNSAEIEAQEGQTRNTTTNRSPNSSSEIVSQPNSNTDQNRLSSGSAATAQDVLTRSRFSSSTPSAGVSNVTGQSSIDSRGGSNPAQNRFSSQSQSRERSSSRYNFYDPPVASHPPGTMAPTYSAPRNDLVRPEMTQPSSSNPAARGSSVTPPGSSIYRPPSVAPVSPPNYQPPPSSSLSGGGISRPTSPGAASNTTSTDSRANRGGRSGR